MKDLFTQKEIRWATRPAPMRPWTPSPQAAPDAKAPKFLDAKLRPESLQFYTTNDQHPGGCFL